MLLKSAGRCIHYDLIGPPDAPAVCFAHALAADSGMWAEQIPALLAAGLRVLRVDMRGHGGSDPPAGNATLDELADDIAAVIDALAIERVHFVGLSIGGMIGQALGLRHLAKVASLMLCESPPASLPNVAQIWAPRIAAVQAAGSCAPIADGTMERWLSPDFRARQPGRWRQIRDTVEATDPAGYLACIHALSHFDFTAQLPSLRVPALALYGEDDVASSAEENERLAALIPGGRFVPFAGARHLPNVEAPERFNRILLDWLGAQS
ncbi:MAG TPA: alpha/beta fold hydrolase [Xanthobacteraceae bacterium]